MSQCLFVKNGTFCLIKKTIPYEKTAERGWIVSSQKLSNDSDYNEAIKYANIISNIKYLKADYGTTINNKSEDIHKKTFDRFK